MDFPTKTMASVAPAGGDDLMRGERLGSLRIEGVLGRGGMGTVYLAFDETLERSVALKSVRDRTTTDPVARGRFLAEARALSKLDHPHICRIYDFLKTSRGQFLVLELVEGKPLSRVISEGLSFRRALVLGLQLADAVATAHANGIVHRDLKPANVMVDSQERIRVLDFGLALGRDPQELRPEIGDSLSATIDESPSDPTFSLFDERSPLVRPVVGTPNYMSPEQAGGLEVGPATDIYALALILGAMLSGEGLRPRTSSAKEALAAARTGRVAVPRSLRSDVRRLLERCLAPEPSHRPTASEVHRILSLAINRRRRIVGRFLAAALVAALIGAGVKYSLDLRDERDKARLAQEEASEAFELFEQVLLASDPMTSSDQEDFTVGGLLTRGLVAMDEQLEDRPEVAARLRMATGKVLRNAGELEEAEEQLRRARAAVLEGNDSRAKAEVAVVLGDILRTKGEYQEAEQLYLEGQGLMGSYEPSVQARVSLSNNLALLYTDMLSYEAAEEAYAQALESLRQAEGGSEGPVADQQRDLGARLKINLALLHQEQNEHEEALGYLESAIPVLEETMGRESPEFYVVTNNLARSLAATARYEEADRAFEKARDGLRNHLGSGHPFVAIANHNWALMLKDAGQPERAEELFLAALEGLAKNFDRDHPRLLRGVLSYGNMLMELDRLEDARDLVLRHEVATVEVESTEFGEEIARFMSRIRGADSM